MKSAEIRMRINDPPTDFNFDGDADVEFRYLDKAGLTRFFSGPATVLDVKYDAPDSQDTGT